MLTDDVPMGSLTFKGTASAIYLILHCQAYDFLCNIYCTEVCLPVMCSTSKLPVKTHDQATDYMVNLPIQK